MDATSKDELQERLPQQEAEVDSIAAEHGRMLLRENDGKHVDLPPRRRPSMLHPVGVHHA